MNKIWIVGLIMTSMLSFAVPSNAVVAPPTLGDVTTVATVYVPPAIVVQSGDTILFSSAEVAQHHNVRTSNGVFLGHLMPTGSIWSCDPGDHFTSTCFDLQVTAPSGTTILYRCDFHAWMTGAIVVV